MAPTPEGEITPEKGPESNRDRRARERRIWQRAFVLSAILHLLLFLVGPSAGDPDSPFAAAGPREHDDRAAEGAMRAVALSSAPAEPLPPPVLPMLEVDIPEPEEVELEPTPEIEISEPEVPRPGVGATTGTDAEDTGDPGIPGADGRGDVGTTEEGRFRVVPPSPRGMIIPPTNSRMRGSQIQVWVFVNEQGRVVADSTRLDPATSDRRFNRQLMEEAAQWVFEPARRDGAPVAAWFPYTISM